MAYESLGEGALDYLPCRYGKSKLLFRGPRRRLDGDYVSVIGGTETYGKFIEKPFSSLVEDEIQVPAVNFGCVNAGADAFLNDPTVLEACSKARLTVVQVMGAQNMSNRFYAVHPRRNDRFLKASVLMKTVFREIDFTDFHFTRHMLSTIKAVSEERFALVEDELKAAWRARMQHLLEKITGKIIILWIDGSGPEEEGGLGGDPLFIDKAMIESIRPYCTEVVQVNLSEQARKEGVTGMVYPEMEEPVAKEMMGLRAHQEISDTLSEAIKRLI